MNDGKKFEQQFKKSAENVNGVWIYRFRDGTGSWDGSEKTRFQAPNICDFELFYKRTLFLFELKHHHGASIPFSAIRENQIKQLSKAAKNDWIVSGIVVFFKDKERIFFLDAATVEHYYINSGRKSIPISVFEEHGIEFDVVKIRTSYKINIKKTLNELIEVYKENGGNLQKPYSLQCGRLLESVK